VRPPFGGGLHWRLISHLSPNHLSLSDGGVEALQDILRLYDLGGRPEITTQIASIVKVDSAAAVSRVVHVPRSAKESEALGVAFCRGLDVTIDFEEAQLDGVFLFASVLERFLPLYSAINSYSRLKARSRQRVRNEGVLKQWSPRIGEQALL
jgi:type VI secretion system protein ImpG